MVVLKLQGHVDPDVYGGSNGCVGVVIEHAHLICVLGGSSGCAAFSGLFVHLCGMGCCLSYTIVSTDLFLSMLGQMSDLTLKNC